MRRFVFALIAAVFMAMTATAANAFGHGRGPGYGPCPQGDIHHRIDALNLSTEQMAKIREIRDAQKKEVTALQQLTFAKRDEIRKLWLEPAPDETKILAAQKEMRSLRDQMEDRSTAFRLRAAKVLTAEQRERIGLLMQGHDPRQRLEMGWRPRLGLGAAGEECCFGKPERQ